MAARNEPNFALFMCKVRKFSIIYHYFHFFNFNHSKKRHFNGFTCVVYVFRVGIMQSIECKMDFKN